MASNFSFLLFFQSVILLDLLVDFSSLDFLSLPQSVGGCKLFCGSDGRRNCVGSESGGGCIALGGKVE